MGKFDGVLLASDFDDTLYDYHGQVPQANVDALHYFIRQGGRFSVATGRAHRTFAPYAHLAPMNAPAVLSNGSALYDFAGDRMLFQTFLREQAPQDLERLAQAFPEIGFEAYFGEEIFVYQPNAVTDSHMAKVGTQYTLCTRIADMPTPWTKVILQQDYGYLLQVQAWMKEHCPGAYEVIFSNKYLLEVTDAGSHKGGMVKKLAEYLEIAPEHIYCVGDNQNDIPMLALSAIPFAPANCAQEVKDWGARILCHCNEGVIAPIVEILDQRY